METIIFDLSKIVLIGMLIIFVLILGLNLRVTNKTIIVLWSLFIIALASFSFFAEPTSETDLYRHYANINWMRKINRNVYYDSPLLVRNLLFFLISLSDNNGWLPVVSVLTFGFCVGCVSYNYLKKHHVPARIAILYFGGCLGCVSVFALITGIRNIMAFSIWYLGYYFFYSKREINNLNNIKLLIFDIQRQKKYSDKRIVIYYVISLVAILIHPAALICFLMALIYYHLICGKWKQQMPLLFFLFFILMFFLKTSVLKRALDKLPISYASLLVEKLELYSNYKGVTGRTSLFILIVILIFYGCNAIYLFTKNRCELNFSIFIIFMTIMAGCINIAFLERFIILIGILSLQVLHETYLVLSKNNRIIYFLTALGVLGLRLLISFYTLFNYVIFNGESFGELLRVLF